MFPAVFLALLAPQLRDPQARRAAIAGGLGRALAGHGYVPVGVPIIAAAAVGVPLTMRAARQRHGVTGEDAMSWWPVIALCAGAYGLKALGLAVGGRLDPDVAERWRLEFLVVPILAALIAVQSSRPGIGSCSTRGRRHCWSPRCSSGAGRRSSSSRLAAAATAALLRLSAVLRRLPRR